MVHARHLGVESERCIVFAEDPERLVATIGLRDMVIGGARKALLVMPKARAQDVRKIVEMLGEGDANGDP